MRSLHVWRAFRGAWDKLLLILLYETVLWKAAIALKILHNKGQALESRDYISRDKMDREAEWRSMLGCAHVH